MPKINREEYDYLCELDDWIFDGRVEYLVRMENGDIALSVQKPEWHKKDWLIGDGGILNDTLKFKGITRRQIYSIDELIDEYESEETEVKELKNLKEVKETIESEIIRYERYPDDDGAGHRIIALTYVLGLLDQLDEPEVLSQEWIDWHKEYVGKRPDGTRVEVVKEKYLQNLLVPKQELPVIPKFVADYIEEVKPDKSLRVAFEYIAQRKRNNHADELASWVYEGNSETLARAWLDGYTVKKEQKYYLKTGNLYLAEPLGDMTSDIVRMTRDKEVAYQFTDEKSIAIHLDIFEGIEAVKVEEEEE